MSNRNVLNIELTTPQDDDRPVYLSGNFCNWFPDVSAFEMTKVTNGKYAYTFSPDLKLPEKIEYKYTRGGWNEAELDNFGNTPKNRIITANSGRFEDYVPFWRKSGSTPQIKTFMPQIKVLSENFLIPQLDKSRRIHILLPHDYETNPTKHYPVLYMQDAQNLFGNGSPYGNWEIDKRLSLLAKQGKGDLIVVAIEHGEDGRFSEYSPYTVAQKGRGTGMKYANFLIRNLKPFVDANYRTKPERQYTGVGGSSMGGLISIYAGIMYPETFGRLMIFSPSLWVSPKIYFDAIEFFNPIETKMYLFGGGKEGASMIPNLTKLKQTIENQKFSEEKIQIHLSTNLTAEHSEKYWGQEFSKAVDWLYY